MDFNDVFGGPPRSFSMQEMRLRYSFDQKEEMIESSLPIFGKETVPKRRHHHADDFFDDIFRGDDSYTSSRRSFVRDWASTLGSSPGSRVMSPARPLPLLQSELAHFRASDFPTFGSNDYAEYKMDAIANGLSSPQSANNLSRFSSEAIGIQDVIASETHQVYLRSSLSHDACFISEDSPTATSMFSGNMENVIHDKRDAESVGNKFHPFSIYKWASREAATLMSPVDGTNTVSKDRHKYDKSASSNERIESKSSTCTNHGLASTDPESLQIERKKHDLRSEGKDIKLQILINEETLLEVSGSKSSATPHNVILFGRSTQSMVKQVKSCEIDMQDETEPLQKERPLYSNLKPLHAWLSDDVEQPGNVSAMKEKKNINLKGVSSNCYDVNNVRENEDIRTYANKEAGDRSTTQASAFGKVREFVQIFNQEAVSRPIADFQIQGSELKENGVKVGKNVDLQNIHKKQYVSVKVDENPNKDELVQEQDSHTKIQKNISNHFSTDYSYAFSSETLHKDSTTSHENSEYHLEDDFLVMELSDVLEEVTFPEESEDTNAILMKIEKWSAGKKGNIRSLLSTLQYVLWPGSGWNPVPLVDLIETNSVKRAYQKALLLLHPDKLQQKGAAFHHKYVAEKVFDIFQEAWDTFNDLAPL